MAPELPSQRYARLAADAVEEGEFMVAVEYWKSARTADNVCATHAPRRVCCAQCLENRLLHQALAGGADADRFKRLAGDLRTWLDRGMAGP